MDPSIPPELARLIAEQAAVQGYDSPEQFLRELLAGDCTAPTAQALDEAVRARLMEGLSCDDDEAPLVDELLWGDDGGDG